MASAFVLGQPLADLLVDGQPPSEKGSSNRVAETLPSAVRGTEAVSRATSVPGPE